MKSDSNRTENIPQLDIKSIKNNYRHNYLRYMYISFALGLIANAKERERLVEYSLYMAHPTCSFKSSLDIVYFSSYGLLIL